MLKEIGPVSKPQDPRPMTLPQLIAAIEAVEFGTNYDQALGEAASSKKIVLAAFTGPNWCGPCIDLENEVFSKFEFKEWAISVVVLLKLEHADKNSPPADQQLYDQYDVDGIPQVLGLDAQGVELGRVVGYASGMGVKNWIDAFKSATGLP